MEQSDLDQIFNYQDPNVIAEMLQIELNVIINSLAPAKVVQYRVDYIPFLNDRVKRDMEYTQKLLQKAINKHGVEDWREYRHSRNLVNKQLKIIKRNYIKQKFKDTNSRYKFKKKTQ